MLRGVSARYLVRAEFSDGGRGAGIEEARALVLACGAYGPSLTRMFGCKLGRVVLGEGFRV